MTRFKDLKVKTKLTMLFAIIMILILAFVYMCITSITTMTERHEEVYDEYGAGASYLGEITYNFELMSIKAELIMLTQNEQARENAITIYTNAKTQMQTHIENFVFTFKSLKRVITLILHYYYNSASSSASCSLISFSGEINKVTDPPILPTP